MFLDNRDLEFLKLCGLARYMPCRAIDKYDIPLIEREALGVDTSDAAIKVEEPVFTNDGDIEINIDGNYKMVFPDQKPIIMNDRVMVPIRALMETLEKNVEWDDTKKQTIISDDTVTVILTVGDSKMTRKTKNPIDGNIKTEEITLDVAPIIQNGRTCLPVRAVAESFGAAVIWEAETNRILIIAGVC